MADSISYRWVLAQYPANSEMGKKVLAEEKAGSGYRLINKDRSKTQPIIVAFKYFGYPIPSHLREATREQSEKLEKRLV